MVMGDYLPIDCRLDDTATVGLEIRDLNDNLPMFSQSVYSGGRVSMVQGTHGSNVFFLL